MSSIRAALGRTFRPLATVVAGTALLVACSNTTPGPSGVATAASRAPVASQAGPAASAPPTSLRVAPSAPCSPGRTGTVCIAPGRYVLDDGLSPGIVTIDVPAGWFEWDPGGGSEGLLVDRGSDAPNGSGWGLLFTPIGNVSRDPCDAKKGSLPSNATAGDVVAVMARWPGFTATTTPRPVAIGGVAGEMIGLTYTNDPLKCSVATIWTTPSGTPIDAYPMVADPSRPAQFRILDVRGSLLAIRTTDYPELSPFEIEQGVRADPNRHVADELALRAMVNSIQFTP
jgi:hypothetical protein